MLKFTQILTKRTKMKTQNIKGFFSLVALCSVLLAQNALAKPPHELDFAPHEKPHLKAKQGQGFAYGELPHIKGIAPEIFASASQNAQIKALQVEMALRKDLHKDLQKFKDEREELELQKRITQVKFYHAKAQNDEKQVKDLLAQIYQNEQALNKNKIAEREFRSTQELKRAEKLYKELQGK